MAHSCSTDTATKVYAQSPHTVAATNPLMGVSPSPGIPRRSAIAPGCPPMWRCCGSPISILSDLKTDALLTHISSTFSHWALGSGSTETLSPAPSVSSPPAITRSDVPNTTPSSVSRRSQSWGKDREIPRIGLT